MHSNKYRNFCCTGNFLLSMLKAEYSFLTLCLDISFRSPCEVTSIQGRCLGLNVKLGVSRIEYALPGGIPVISLVLGCGGHVRG